jgi:hypothetical protein
VFKVSRTDLVQHLPLLMHPAVVLTCPSLRTSPPTISILNYTKLDTAPLKNKYIAENRKLFLSIFVLKIPQKLPAKIT